MSRWPIQMNADELNAALASAFPAAQGPFNLVREVAPGRVTLVQEFDLAMLRPGGAISGPVMISLADTAGYMIVMAHVGRELMAVTSSLTMNFLRPAKPGALHADAQLLSLGRRMVVCDVRIWTEAQDRPAAQATVTYARGALTA